MSTRKSPACLLATLLCCACIAGAGASTEASKHADRTSEKTSPVPTRGGIGTSQALLLTEITVASEGAEFIEIHNPTRSPTTCPMST